MADEPAAPGTAEGAGRRKRPAPTIDLTATEVKSESDAQAQGEQSDAADSSSATESTDELKPNVDENRATGVAWAMLASGFAGGAVVAAVLAALWFADALPVRTSPGSSTAALNARIAQLEAQLRKLSAAPADDNDKALNDLSQRIGNIESVLAKLPAENPALGDRLTAIESSLKSFGIALTALTHRSDDTAATAKAAAERADAAAKAVAQLQTQTQNALPIANKDEIDALNKRIAALERTVKAASVSDKAARLALSAASLRDAVARGEPFAVQLADVKSLGADANKLAPLQIFATTGIPSAETLARELNGLIPVMRKASGAEAETGGFLARLQAHAKNIVHVSPVDAPTGNDPDTILTRLEVEASHNDIAGAVKDIAKLPADVRAPADAWLQRARQRQAAIDASRALVADTAAALSNTAPHGQVR
ncbi:MAG: COG4223 family protein [Acidobacteriota bacterium]